MKRSISKNLPRYTYNDIYGVVYENFTTHHLAHLCTDLENEFGDGYILRPEPITEGGIVFNGYPDQKDQLSGQSLQCGYKSFRFTGFPNRTYPYICNLENSTEYLLSIPPIVLCSPVMTKRNTVRKEKIRFVLKAFRGAPIWTVEDLQKFKKCLNKYGIDLIVNKKTYHSTHSPGKCLCCPNLLWKKEDSEQFTVPFQARLISDLITEHIVQGSKIDLVNNLILSYSFAHGYDYGIISSKLPSSS
jgi:hypothetical protein